MAGKKRLIKQHLKNILKIPFGSNNKQLLQIIIKIIRQELIHSDRLWDISTIPEQLPISWIILWALDKELAETLWVEREIDE